MAFNWLIAPLAAIILAASVPAPVAHTDADIAGTVPRVLQATAENEARCYECTLGDATADAIREATGSDAAVVCGGDLVRNMLPGEITYEKLEACYESDRIVSVVKVTPKTLCSILEAGLSHVTLNEEQRIDVERSVYDGFPQISGLMLQYDASAPAGERVHKLKLGKEPLDTNDDVTIISLAATEHMLNGGYGMPVIEGGEPTELTLSDAMAWYLHQEMPDYYETGLRIYPIGSKEGSIMDYVPFGMVFLLLIIVGLGNSQRFKHMVDFRP